ncbi:MAG TPA: type 1 glutamine amidotransferase [Allosphingosinicella sp.]|jgi:GMP synthase-like glutamine amidotransferase|nr:type 1 glutamine amidotransferase [Allosphingosinicella sp.]
MDLAIFETGKPPAALQDRFERYPAMFEHLLGLKATSYDVEAGEYPDRPDAHAAYLVTGAAAGVYDDLPWIRPLEDFLRAAKGKAKLVGVCFGHQVMAEAFGGHVEKSIRGWGAGLQRYQVVVRAPWMDDAPFIDIPVSHQDQIVIQPPHTHILASSDFSPFGMLAYEDQPAISMQFHPEFEPAYAKALIESRFDRVPDPEAAIVSLDAPDDRWRVAQWILNFLSQ